MACCKTEREHYTKEKGHCMKVPVHYKMMPEDRTIGLFSEDCTIVLFSEGYMIVLFSEVLYKSYCFHHKVLYRMDRIQLKLSQNMYINIID